MWDSTGTGQPTSTGLQLTWFRHWSGLAVLFAIGVVATGCNSPPSDTDSQAATSKLNWEEYTPEAFESARESQRPILVFCQADWDINAKIIEKTIFNDDVIQNTLTTLDFILLDADFTESSPAITRYLKETVGDAGNAAVVVYSADPHVEPLVYSGQMPKAPDFNRELKKIVNSGRADSTTRDQSSHTPSAM